MELAVSFPGGMRVDAQFGNFIVRTDQPKEVGGEASAPDPFSYFLTGLITCAGYYVLRFCQVRNIASDNVKLKMKNDWNKEKGRAENFYIQIELPPSFPTKYTSALVRAINECSVKKTLMNPPNIEITTKTLTG